MRTARPSRVTPALFTSTSMRPNCCSALATPSRIESYDSRSQIHRQRLPAASPDLLGHLFVLFDLGRCHRDIETGAA